MVSKYQRESLNLLNEVFDKIEAKTEKRKSLKIGVIRYELYTGPDYEEVYGDLYILANYSNIYKVRGTDFVDEFDIIDDNSSFISFNKNIFEDLKTLLKEIDEENIETNKFHQDLNNKLTKLNKALE